MPKIPSVNHQDAVRALEKAGFLVVRQGKHIVMRKGERFVTIPRHNPIKAFTRGGIAQDAGLKVNQSIQWVTLNRESLGALAPAAAACALPS